MDKEHCSVCNAFLALQGEPTLVITFASAPGLPNWGGLLRKVHQNAAEPAHQCFDTLYVVDPSRSWYDGETPAFAYISLLSIAFSVPLVD